MLFKHRIKPLLGVDISSTAVKLLELGGSRQQPQVVSYAAVGLPPDSVIDKQVTDPEAVGQAIRKAVKQSGTRTREAVVAVGGATVISKVITMPADLSEHDLEQQIRLEADQYVPYPLEEVGLDFEVLGASTEEDHAVDVLLAACRNDIIDSRVAALHLSGLICKVVDIESNALENACLLIAEQMQLQNPDQGVAVIDIGATTTTLNIMHGGSIIYSRDQAFGGKLLTEEIMAHYGLSYEEAGKAKRRGGLPETYGEEVLKPFMQDVSNQIDRALQFFFSSNNRIDKIGQIVLAGGCASIPGLDQTVEEQMEVATRIANPFANMKILPRARPKQLKLDAPALMTACGLAMRSFD
ncbi:pilus assembly protein PilM [Candidatus Macondimonas diazotrophica]|uniref:Pilus assembly protein PilM n=1 Tax=Candidatus Macondimonas diazotrophica TaxID=2305248 RepID=A0A4Z0F9I1_9GAMM|nr:pilus assembly protein PilM [Candidatus Macondimonas diazotrophica]NCU00245.1 pilus assembly protein PilM [Candidatus Macondimonas diazotrophica]TFZ83034.1 pilus assembly protein PilM [Candidatus Macondimonas diazotrophica]HBG29368.1 pilus assembly protein PilM [Gammaproteobacteria bacterium]